MVSIFACKCGCDFDSPDPYLVDVVHQLAEAFGPVHISSGCRCPVWNREVGGSPNSYHQNGMAADVQVPGVPTSQVYDWLLTKYGAKLGLIEYRDFVHVDTRGWRVPYQRPAKREGEP